MYQILRVTSVYFPHLSSSTNTFRFSLCSSHSPAMWALLPPALPQGHLCAPPSSSTRLLVCLIPLSSFWQVQVPYTKTQSSVSRSQGRGGKKRVRRNRDNARRTYKAAAQAEGRTPGLSVLQCREGGFGGGRGGAWDGMYNHQVQRLPADRCAERCYRITEWRALRSTSWTMACIMYLTVLVPGRTVPRAYCCVPPRNIYWCLVPGTPYRYTLRVILNENTKNQ